MDTEQWLCYVGEFCQELFGVLEDIPSLTLPVGIVKVSGDPQKLLETGSLSDKALDVRSQGVLVKSCC